MRIKSIYVNNFKSLVDFKIDLAKFNCLIGLNGSGKSTFLQFMDFLAQLMKGKMNEWFAKRKWAKDSLSFYRDNKNNRILFEICFSHVLSGSCETEGMWKAEYWTSGMKCLSETIRIAQYEFNSSIYEKSPKQYIVLEDGAETLKSNINFNYEGSIFSQLTDETLPKEFNDIKKAIKNILSFGLMTPQYLKQNVKGSFNTVGYEGEHLASFVHELDDAKRAEITRKIKKVYPSFGFFKSDTLHDQSRELTIGDVFHEGYLVYQTPARYVNDGLLRVIAFLSQLESSKSFLLFDEIENGINPELVDFLLKEFLNAKQQIVVTTHSPLFMNYLPDDEAKKSVQYFYKTPDGYTRTIPFFEIPSIAQKLEVMGPGEAFADTDLVGLAREISRITAKEE